MLNVSIVTYNTPADELEKCLGCLTSREVACIYVVDNSRRGYIRDICRLHPKTVYIPNPNHGYGQAHNIAIRRTLEMGECTHHLILNSDVVFDAALPERMLDMAHRDKRIGILQPKMFDGEGKPMSTARALPSPADLILRRFFPKWLMRGKRRRYLLESLDHTKPINAPNLQGSFMLLSMDAVKECGLFDERFFMYPEDIDLTRRIHRSYLTLWHPGITATHYHRQSSYKSLRMLWVHITNMIKYFNKWGWMRDVERKKANAVLFCSLQKMH